MERFTEILALKCSEINKESFDKIGELKFFTELADSLIRLGDKWYNYISLNSLFVGYFRTINNIISFDELYNKSQDLKEILNDVSGNLKIYNMDFDELEISTDEVDLSCFNEYEEDAKIALEKILYIKFYYKLEEELSTFDAYKELKKESNFDGKKKIVGKISKKFKNKMTNNLRNRLGIDKFKSDIISYKNTLQKEYNRYKNKKSKYVDDQLTLLKNLKGLINNKSLINLDSNLINLASDEEVLYELYRVVSIYNMYYYKFIKSENEELQKHSTSYFEKIFYEYNLNFNNYDEETKKLISKKCDLNFLEKILNTNYINDFIYSDVGVAVLTSNNIEVLNNITNLINNGTISSKVVSTYPSILIDKNDINDVEPLYNKLQSIIEITKKANIKINDDNFKYLFESNNEDLIRYFEFIDEYNLDVNNYYLLENIDSIHKIDDFIELGLHDFIINNLKYLKYKNITKRIYICNMLNIDIFDGDKIKSSITSGGNFYVDDEKLDDYIIDLSEHLNIKEGNYENDYLEIIKKLDKYKINNNVYLIDDINLSRNRVIRNLKNNSEKYNYNDLILYSFIKDSILDKNSFDKVKVKIKQ